MIKMNTSVAGDNFSLKVGEVTDRFTKEEEKRFVETGQAEFVKKTRLKSKKNPDSKS